MLSDVMCKIKWGGGQDGEPLYQHTHLIVRPHWIFKQQVRGNVRSPSCGSSGGSPPVFKYTRCALQGITEAQHTSNKSSFTPTGGFTVPESPSAVLALVPDPSREAHTVARRRVALAVHTRFVAFLRLGEAGQPGEQPDNREQERRGQHQQAPAPVGARTGPPCRPVHSLTKDGCWRQTLCRCGNSELPVDVAPMIGSEIRFPGGVAFKVLV